MPEAAVAHDCDRTPGHVGRDRRGAGQRHAVAENGIAERERRESRKRMAADIGADVGRSQFALHQLDGSEHRALRAAGAERRRARRQRAERGSGLLFVRDQAARFFRHAVGVEAVRPGVLQKRREAFQQHVGGIFAGLRQRPLAEHAGLHVGAAQFDVDRLLDVIGIAFLDHQHRMLAGAEFADFLRHQRIDHVEHQQRHARVAEHIGQPHALERAQHGIGQSAHDDDADIVELAGNEFVELVRADEGARGRQAFLDLELFLAEGHRRVRQPRIVEAWRPGNFVEAGEFRLAIVLGGELAGGVAGADAQLQHHRRVARLRQLEAFLHHAHDRRQIGTRIEQPHRGFQGVGIRALLDHAGALAIVLADDDHGSTDHAGRRQVGERVGRHIGADDGFPGHRAA